MHRTCYATLFKYLMDKGIPFSMDAALDWLEIKKREISYETCSQYRNALFRLEHYLLFGDIKSSFCRSEDSFFCRSGISESFFRLTYELEEYYATTQNPCYYHTYSVAIKEFFRLATSLGVTEPEAITIDTLIEYWNTYCKSCKSLARRQNAVCAMTALMKYLHRRGDVPECYQRVLFGENVEILLELRGHCKTNRTSFGSDRDRIQTCNRLIRSQLLYSVELRGHYLLFFCFNGCKDTDFF